MTQKRFTIFGEWHKDCVIDEIRDNTGEYVTIGRVVDLLNENEQLKQSNQELNDELQETMGYLALKSGVEKENEQLKQFIKELTTKGTGKIDLASGYSYNVNAVLTDYRGDVE